MKFKTWQTRHYKLLLLESPHFQTEGMKIETFCKIAGRKSRKIKTFLWMQFFLFLYNPGVFINSKVVPLLVCANHKSSRLLWPGELKPFPYFFSYQDWHWKSLSKGTSSDVMSNNIHSSFKQKISVKQFLLGLWYYFRHYRPQLILHRWIFLSSKFRIQMALQQFETAVKIWAPNKNWTPLSSKKNFCYP